MTNPKDISQTLHLIRAGLASGLLTLEQTVGKLFRLKFEAVFTEIEESYIYSIDDKFDCAKNNIFGTLEAVYEDVERFLSSYEDYSLNDLK